MTKILKRQANETKLQRHVRLWLNDYGNDYGNGYTDGWRGALHDLLQGGCQAGTVGHLVYYRDTVAFYKTHKSEINALLGEALQDCGYRSPAEMFGDKWKLADPLALDIYNQNLLAWFAFEETARQLGAQAGEDV